MGERLNLGAEPPSVELCRVAPPPGCHPSITLILGLSKALQVGVWENKRTVFGTHWNKTQSRSQVPLSSSLKRGTLRDV